MNKVWLSAILGDGISPRKKYIVCNNEEEPLIFDTQLNALEFWREHKSKFAFPDNINHRCTRVTPQVIPEDDDMIALFDLLEPRGHVTSLIRRHGRRLALTPHHSYIFYAGDDETNAEYLGEDERLRLTANEQII